MEELDWDKGLPLDLLSAIAVAGGHEAMKAMRGVSHTWKAGYERSVTAIKLTRTGPMLPPGGAFAGRFPAARSVDFQKCLMAKERPAESLERLAGAQITCVALPDCGTLLRNKTLDDSDIAHLRGLPLLTRLDLYGCSRITDAGIAHLRGLPLEDLDLGRCHRLTEAGLAHALHGMPLRRLVLEDFRGLADVPEQAAAAEGGGEAAETMPEALNALLGAFPLTELSLALTIVADFDLELLPPSLTRLNLGACYNLTDEGLARLRGFPLEDLDLTSDSEMMTLAGLAHLRGMPLRRLILANWDCPGGALGAFPEGLSPLAGMPLTELSLANSDVTDSGLNLLRGLPLTCLSLSGCDRVSPAGLSALEGLSLTDLNLGCWRVTDAVLGHLRGMPLAALTLGGCHLITDAGLLNLRGAPLTCLDLVSTGITGPGLRALRGAPLTDLELCRCRNITCSGIGLSACLLAKCPRKLQAHSAPPPPSGKYDVDGHRTVLKGNHIRMTKAPAPSLLRRGLPLYPMLCYIGTEQHR